MGEYTYKRPDSTQNNASQCQSSRKQKEHSDLPPHTQQSSLTISNPSTFGTDEEQYELPNIFDGNVK